MLAKYIIPMQISADQTVKFMCTLRFAYLYKAAKRGERRRMCWLAEGDCSAQYWLGLNGRLPLE